jgi:hypothetical protein
MTGRHARKGLTSAIAIGGLALLVLHTTAAPGAAQTGSRTTVTLRPLSVQAPIFGAQVDLPRLPSAPSTSSGDDDGSALSGTTDAALNSAYMAGVEIQSRWWFAEINGLWAALSAERSSPLVHVKSDANTFNARGGVRLFAGFGATAGVRYLKVDLDASLTLPRAGQRIDGSTTATLWDPLFGLDWRGTFGRIALNAYAQGGGFGVGADVDASGQATLDWRVAGPFTIRAGYTVLYYKFTVADVHIGSFDRTLVSRQTLHGPVVGFGFVF